MVMVWGFIYLKRMFLFISKKDFRWSEVVVSFNSVSPHCETWVRISKVYNIKSIRDEPFRYDLSFLSALYLWSNESESLHILQKICIPPSAKCFIDIHRYYNFMSILVKFIDFYDKVINFYLVEMIISVWWLHQQPLLLEDCWIVQICDYSFTWTINGKYCCYLNRFAQVLWWTSNFPYLIYGFNFVI